MATELAAASMALGRRYAAGATLWCWSPRWPEHADHVAVEFVHPVIVGKRALPASVVDGHDAIATLRTLVSPGDVLVAVAGEDDEVVASGMRRARAWGVTTILIGAGGRPPAGLADHQLWYGDDNPDAPHNGAFVLLYHLLWELTHVCFEHPGLVNAAPSDGGTEEVCITCSDEGRLGEVMEIPHHDGTRVRTATGVEDVDTTLVDPVGPGDLVLVHAGVAISRLDGEGP